MHAFQQASDFSGPEKKTRKKKSKMGVLAADITQEELAKWFHLPSEEACCKLGISLTVLKRVCRKYGIQRWPFRKVKSLERMIGNLSTALPAPLTLPTSKPPSARPSSNNGAGFASPPSIPLHTVLQQQQQQQQQRRLQPALGLTHASSLPICTLPPGSPTSTHPSEGSSLATSAMDKLLAAAGCAAEAQSGSPQDASSAQQGDLTLPLTDRGGEEEGLEEGELPREGSGASWDDESAMPSSPGSSGDGLLAGPAAAATAPWHPIPSPSKLVSVKHMLLAKWEQMSQHAQQGTACASQQAGCSDLSLGLPTAPCSGAPVEECRDADAGKEASGRVQLGSTETELLQDDSCGLERLPTFGFSSGSETQQPQSRQRCAARTAAAAAASPAFSFGCTAPPAPRHASAPQEMSVADLHSVEGGEVGSRGNPDRKASSPTTPPAAGGATTAASLPGLLSSSPSSSSAAPVHPEQDAQRAAAWSCGQPTQPASQRQQPCTTRKRPPGDKTAPFQPSPFNAAKRQKAAGPGHTPSHVPAGPAVATGMGTPAGAVPGSVPLSVPVQLVWQPACVKPTMTQPPLGGSAAGSQMLLSQQAQAQAQQAAGAVQWRVVVQQGGRQQGQQLLPQESASESHSGSGIPQPKAARGGGAPGAGASLAQQHSMAKVAALRAQLQGALHQVGQGQKVNIPSRLALYCLQRYAHKLGFVLQGASLARLESVESRGLGAGATPPAQCE